MPDTARTPKMVRFDAELLAQVDAYAERYGYPSFNAAVTRLVRIALEAENAKPEPKKKAKEG